MCSIFDAILQYRIITTLKHTPNPQSVCRSKEETGLTTMNILKFVEKVTGTIHCPLFQPYLSV
uniref:Uncharacterized protein n=1 Tax=Arion vulgaris TaxID=1028688 RepID=A0A0B6ZMF8_9EUPU